MSDYVNVIDVDTIPRLLFIVCSLTLPLSSHQGGLAIIFWLGLFLRLLITLNIYQITE